MAEIITRNIALLTPLLIHRARLFTCRIARAAQIFLRVVDKEEAHVVARFAGLVEGCADDMNEDDHIHQDEANQPHHRQAGDKWVDISNEQEAKQRHHNGARQDRCRGDKANPLDVIHPVAMAEQHHLLLLELDDEVERHIALLHRGKIRR